MAITVLAVGVGGFSMNLDVYSTIQKNKEIQNVGLKKSMELWANDCRIELENLLNTTKSLENHSWLSIENDNILIQI